MLVYKIIHQNRWKEQDFSIPASAMSWVHLFHSQEENSLFLLLTAPGQRLAPRRSVWGFREERKMSGRFPPPVAVCRSTPDFQHLTCQCSPPFISKEVVVGLGWGIKVKHSLAQMVRECWFFFNPRFIWCYDAVGGPAVVFSLCIFDYSVHSECKMSGGMDISFQRKLNSLGDSALHCK